ncbi:choice-of-anchor P family protein [Microlunatus flavus]|uniref:Uncharacterized protein n=1 Tax=Microlunatus flavus TaxID=1036181 RepID=A0A1H9HAJ4_9ACTN|nr:choice-of-anchor P family protein [Microlunatus flavus]SEQ59379.1 hypothetical protein SAMN05421756_104172 [Microlunatus flavus]
MHRRTTRPLALGTGLTLGAAALLLAAAAPAGAATTAPSTLSLAASAYGSTAKVGAVSSGKTAYFSACSTGAGTPYGTQVAATDLGGLLGKVGAVVTTGTRSGSSVVATSTTGETSLLGGLVKAKAIASTSTSSLAGSQVSSSGSTVITGLTIAGLPRTVPAGSGSTIVVPGVATLTFNAQTRSTTFASKQLTVDALRVDLLKDNKLGLPTGSIVLGSSTTGASAPTAFAAGGQAYGTTLNVGSLVTSGPTAYVGMPCGGTAGAVSRNKVVGLTLPGVATVGTVASTGQSVEGAGSTTATFSSSVAGVNLLNGAVTADAITVKASTTRSAAGLSSTDDGTVVTGLKVLGKSVTLSTKDNATVDVAGVGTLTVRKTVKQATGLDVIGLELRLGSDQPGLAAGTVLQVAAAKSRVAA